MTVPLGWWIEFKNEDKFTRDKVKKGAYIMFNIEDVYKRQVIGYSVLGGDFFEKVNAFIEQMTVWKEITEKNKMLKGYQPCPHDSDRKMWRDFASFAVQKEKNHFCLLYTSRCV